jgi:hypothetical protein
MTRASPSARKTLCAPVANTSAALQLIGDWILEHAAK